MHLGTHICNAEEYFSYIVTPDLLLYGQHFPEYMRYSRYSWIMEMTLCSDHIPSLPSPSIPYAFLLLVKFTHKFIFCSSNLPLLYILTFSDSFLSDFLQFLPCISSFLIKQKSFRYSIWHHGLFRHIRLIDDQYASVQKMYNVKKHILNIRVYI